MEDSVKFTLFTIFLVTFSVCSATAVVFIILLAIGSAMQINGFRNPLETNDNLKRKVANEVHQQIIKEIIKKNKPKKQKATKEVAESTTTISSKESSLDEKQEFIAVTKDKVKQKDIKTVKNKEQNKFKNDIRSNKSNNNSKKAPKSNTKRVKKIEKPINHTLN